MRPMYVSGPWHWLSHNDVLVAMHQGSQTVAPMWHCPIGSQAFYQMAAQISKESYSPINESALRERQIDSK